MQEWPPSAHSAWPLTHSLQLARRHQLGRKQSANTNVEYCNVRRHIWTLKTPPDSNNRAAPFSCCKLNKGASCKIALPLGAALPQTAQLAIISFHHRSFTLKQTASGWCMTLRLHMTPRFNNFVLSGGPREEKTLW